MEANYIKLGDCFELLPEIPTGGVDMILCDLPYGTTANKWDTPLDLQLLWSQYERIIKDNGAIVLFSQQPFTTTLINSQRKLFRYEWIWKKEQATGFLQAHKMPMKIHENILVFYKRLPKYNPQMRTGFKPYSIQSGTKTSNYRDYKKCTTVSNGERFPIDIIEFKRDKSRLHPTQKPVALLEYLIRTYTDEGDVVLDNCMGVGSTCVAAVNTGRKYIGFEMDQDYYNIAEKRIEEAHNVRHR